MLRGRDTIAVQCTIGFTKQSEINTAFLNFVAVIVFWILLIGRQILK